MPGNGSIGRSLFWRVLLFSVLITAGLTSIGAVLDYKDRIDSVERTFDDVNQVQSKAIVEDLWNINVDNLKAQVSGMVNLRYITYVCVTERDKVIAEAGTKRDMSIIARSIELMREHNGRLMRLGTLYLEADKNRVIDDTLRRILQIFLLQAVIVGMIAVFIFMLVQRALTRHLVVAAEYFSSLSFSRIEQGLRLKKVDRNDELDAMVNAFNRMRVMLAAVYEQQSAAQREIEASEKRFRMLIDHAPDAILLYDDELKRFIDVNTQAEILFGYGRQELLGMGPENLYQSNSDRDEFVAGIAEKNARALAGEAMSFERSFTNARGRDVVCEVRLMRMPSEGRVLLRGSFLDITERKRAEDAVLHSLKEKELLLMEVHHRVKNNMAVISSLLNLQSRYVVAQQDRALFKESISRIRSMALIHDRLYQAKDFKDIDLGSYVRDLTRSLFETYKTEPGNIELVVDVEDIRLSIDNAIPCGLIINELLTNALKYAFAGRQGGRLGIVIKRADAGLISLKVSDDGVGLPEGFDYNAPRSMGYLIVTSLVAQIRGSVEVSSEGGTSVTIEFAPMMPGVEHGADAQSQ